MKWLNPDSKSLIFLLTLGDAKLGQFAQGSLHEVLDLRLDDTSDTLPKMWAAHGEDRDSFGQKGRYSLRQLRGQN